MGAKKTATKKTAMQKTLAGGQDYDGDGDGGGGDSGRPSYDTMLERSGGCEYHSRLYLYGILVYISMCTTGHLVHGPDGLNIKILCTTIYITTLNTPLKLKVKNFKNQIH